jgi:hypothetical protein
MHFGLKKKILLLLEKALMHARNYFYASKDNLWWRETYLVIFYNIKELALLEEKKKVISSLIF